MQPLPRSLSAPPWERWRARRRQKQRLRRERREHKRALRAQKRELLQSKLTRSYLWVTLASALLVVAFAWLLGSLLKGKAPRAGDFLGLMLVSGAFLGAFAAIVGAGFGFWVARRLTSRLRAIERAADEWARGHFVTTAPEDAGDEIGQLAKRLNLMARELRELVALRQNLAQAEERNRLARELHDTVKQGVFATSLQIGAARLLLDRDPDAARQKLVLAEELARSAGSELNTLLEQLRPGTYDAALSSLRSSQRPDVALETLARELCQRLGLTLEWRGPTSPPDWTDAAQTTLSRVVQEALSNVARHSGSTRAHVQLERDEDGWQLRIEDEGRGFPPVAPGQGLGLRSMEERARSLPGGQFLRENRPDQRGARIAVRWQAG